MKFDWEKANSRERVQASTRYWWIASRYDGGRCSRCRERIHEDQLIAYDSLERSALCELCVDASGIAAEVGHGRFSPVRKRRPARKAKVKKRPRPAPKQLDRGWAQAGDLHPYWPEWTLGADGKTWERTQEMAGRERSRQP